VLGGHDGGAAAWARAAAAAPDRWRRLVTLAVPPERIVASVRLDARQARRSWYVVAAQLPGAERLFTRNDLALLRRLWRDWSPGYQMQHADLDPLRASFAVPGVARAALGYYRGFATAAAENRVASRWVTLPPQPHLYLHGRDDGCVLVELAEATIGALPHSASRVDIIDGVGHFLHLEDPVGVGARIVDFLGAGRPAALAR
jgi:pimeloyl-ACP methyl ester carboxylesterase